MHCGPRGHRNMYNLTGQPGWVRFGFSPGWVGRSPTGLGPCAQYLIGSQAGAGQQWLLDMMRAQAEALRAQLSQLEERIRQAESQRGGTGSQTS